jgi:uncharacterized protein (TIGR03435 family)
MVIRLLCGLVLSIALLAQSADKAGRFAVAAIRPSRPEEMFSVAVNGRRFSTTQASLKDLINYAYMLHSRQISGGPGWIETDKFDVVAETDNDGRLSQPEARKLVQQLLADRFHLEFHRDRKELSVYEIVSTNERPKLTRSPGDANGFGTLGFPTLGEMVVKNATIAEFANFLQRYVLDRPVLDESGIEGRYEFKLEWTADETQFIGRAAQMAAPSRSVEPPDLFTAFREQLGLRLVPRKGLAPVLVVERVGKPSENSPAVSRRTNISRSNFISLAVLLILRL